MRWDEFLHTADRLTRGATEGDWRSAVSRGYYAAFHYLRTLLLAHGTDVGKAGQSHFNLFTGLNHCGFAPVANVARRLDDLRSRRGAADYELQQSITQSFADHWVQQSRSIIADFGALLNTIPPAQIAAGAKKHLQSIGRIP